MVLCGLNHPGFDAKFLNFSECLPEYYISVVYSGTCTHGTNWLAPEYHQLLHGAESPSCPKPPIFGDNKNSELETDFDENEISSKNIGAFSEVAAHQLMPAPFWEHQTNEMPDWH